MGIWGENTNMAFGIAFTVIFFAVALALIALTVLLLLESAPKILENTVLGVIALLAIDFFGQSTGFKITLDAVSILTSALLGLAGVGLLIILNLLGIRT
jgi:hypothetical protein